MAEPKSNNSRINDIAWQKICDRTDLLLQINQKGFFVVSAKELKVLSDKEQPRLLVKFDFDFERPKVFKINKLNILPLKRGDYVVFQDPENVSYCQLPSEIGSRRPTAYKSNLDLEKFDTLNTGICSTEADAIEVAYLSSLLSHFTGLKKLVRTKAGRFGSKDFLITLPGSKARLPVDKSQMEVDGIFESASSDGILLLEAKLGFHANFHIRQLVYPFIWLQTQTKKKIIPVLLCYSGGEYRLSEFEIGENFGEIKVVRHEYFVIDQYALAPANFEVLSKYSSTPYEPRDIPFPQADDLDMVIDVVRLVQRGCWSIENFVQIFGYVPRQAGYYLNAARYLGFIDSSNILTRAGRLFLSEPRRLERTDAILRSMLGRCALNDSIKLLMSRQYQPSNISLAELVEIIQVNRPGDYTGDTLTRRAVTVKCWLRWLVANCDISSS